MPMITPRETVAIARQQVVSIKRALAGKPVFMTSLTSMTLDDDDVAVALHWLKTRKDWYNNQIVREYESAFADWNGSKYAFAFMGGRVALSACIYALGLRPGDEVVVPGYTCVVVPNAFTFAGIKPVYADVELDTFGMDASSLERRITPNTKAVLLHHLYGLVCRDYERIVKMCSRRNISVIEDCAHSTGASYMGQHVGNRGDVAFYSSERSKVFNTILGGIAITNNSRLAARMNDYYQEAQLPSEAHICNQLNNVPLDYLTNKHSHRWWRAPLARARYNEYRVVSTTPEEERFSMPEGYGQRMPAAIAALGMNQLGKIARYNSMRREVAEDWKGFCDAEGFVTPLVVEESTPVFLRYPVLVNVTEKGDVVSRLQQRLGVQVGVWFKTQLHPTTVSIPGCENGVAATQKCINLPCIL